MRAAILAVAAALLLGLPAAASAHATLETTTPAQGATVARDPGQVVFGFNQAVEGNFGAVRAFDTRGDRVDQGDSFHPAGTGSQIGVHLKPSLPTGTYTATYRVVSADGHIVTGGFVFSIGKAGAQGLTVAQLLGRSNTGAPTEIAFGVARAVQYAAIAGAVGALVFLLLVWLPILRVQAGGDAPWREGSEAFARRVRTIVLASAVLGAVSALAAVVLEAAEAAGISGWSALTPHILREELGTHFGTIWVAGAACWLLVGLFGGVLLRPTSARAPVLRPVALGSTGLALGRRDAPTAVLLGLPLAALLLAPALSGHGSSQPPVIVMFPSITLHVTAMAVWLGGLLTLLVAVPAATRRLDAPERTRLLSGVLDRFSGFALGAVIVLLAAGLVQSYVEVRHFDLLLSTAFGRAVLIKFVLLLVLIGLGAANRRRTLPDLRRAAETGAAPGLAGLILRRTLRAEVALIVVVLGVTGALASYAPADLQYTGPYNATTTIGGKELQVTLDPARVGANELHLYLFDPRTGAQFDGAQQVTVDETLPSKHIGPLEQAGVKSGPGHYTVPGVLLEVPGKWQIAVNVLFDKFDQSTRTLNVTVQ